MPLYNGGRIGSNNKPFTGTKSDDPNYSNVSLLLNGNGTNGSTTFTDSSSNNHTITANGNAQISTAQSKFGGASMYFDGSGDYLVLPDDQNSFSFGTSDFTLECWIYPTGSVTGNLFSQRGSGMSWRYVGNSQFVQFFYGNGSGAFSTSNSSVPLNTWSHVALTRNGNTFTIWVNGQSSATNTITASMDYAIPRIGTSIAYPAEAFQGYIDDFRITKGVARYTSNFTSPTAQLPGGETGTFASGLWTLEEHSVAIRKELWPGLIILIVTDGLVLHLDAGDSASYPGSGTTWTDLSGNGNNGTLTNGPTYSSADGGAIVFDGSDDFVTTGNQLDPDADGLFADASSAWSVTSWFNSDTVAAGDRAITGKGGGTGSAATYVTYQSSGNLNVRLRGGTVTTVSSISTNTWYQVTVTWDGTTAKSYLNGVFATNIAVGTASKQTNNFCIGATNSGGLNRFDGKISQTLVYNRALTASEITQNFDALKGRYGL